MFPTKRLHPVAGSWAQPANKVVLENLLKFPTKRLHPVAGRDKKLYIVPRGQAFPTKRLHPVAGRVQCVSTVVVAATQSFQRSDFILSLGGAFRHDVYPVNPSFQRSDFILSLGDDNRVVVSGLATLVSNEATSSCRWERTIDVS